MLKNDHKMKVDFFWALLQLFNGDPKNYFVHIKYHMTSSTDKNPIIWTFMWSITYF